MHNPWEILNAGQNMIYNIRVREYRHDKYHGFLQIASLRGDAFNESTAHQHAPAKKAPASFARSFQATLNGDSESVGKDQFCNRQKWNFVQENTVLLDRSVFHGPNGSRKEVRWQREHLKRVEKGNHRIAYSSIKRKSTTDTDNLQMRNSGGRAGKHAGMSKV